MNKVDLIGRVATDIEVKECKNKKSYIRFRIAVNSFNGRERKTNFLNVVTWHGKTIEFLQKYISKGDLISLTGEIIEKRYESEEGNIRYFTSIETKSINLLNKSKRKEIS